MGTANQSQPPSLHACLRPRGGSGGRRGGLVTGRLQKLTRAQKAYNELKGKAYEKLTTQPLEFKKPRSRPALTIAL
jgi:hypothetical protein